MGPQTFKGARKISSLISERRETDIMTAKKDMIFKDGGASQLKDDNSAKEENIVLAGGETHKKRIPNLYNEKYLLDALEEVLIDLMEFKELKEDSRVEYSRLFAKLMICVISIPGWYLPFENNRNIVLVIGIIFYVTYYGIDFFERSWWGYRSHYKFKNNSHASPHDSCRMGIKLDVTNEKTEVVLTVGKVKWYGGDAEDSSNHKIDVGQLFYKEKNSAGGQICIENCLKFFQNAVEDHDRLEKMLLTSETKKDQ